MKTVLCVVAMVVLLATLFVLLPPYVSDRFAPPKLYGER